MPKANHNGKSAASIKATADAKAKAAAVAEAKKVKTAEAEAALAAASDASEPTPPADAPSSEPVAETNPTPEPTPTPEVKENNDTDVEGVSPVIVKTLNNYVNTMAMHMSISVGDGVRQQKLLQSGIIRALTVESDKEGMNNIRYILDFINSDTTQCFSMRAIFRFYDMVKWGGVKDRREIETLLTLFINTADPETRAEESDRLEWSAFNRISDPRRADIIMRRLRSVYGKD